MVNLTIHVIAKSKKTQFLQIKISLNAERKTTLCQKNRYNTRASENSC